ncbi:MAG: PEP-CTERM sorting domain-containing protein, partial [Thermoguttaceae bacterium]
GFTNEGNGYWAEAIPASPNYFVFNESNGTLDVQSVVPEPATCIMLVLAAMGIAFYSRKK